MKARGSGATQGTAKPKPGSLESLQTGQNEQARPPPRGKPQLFFNNKTSNYSETCGPIHGHLGSSTGTSVPMPPRPGSSLHDELPNNRRIIPGGSGVKQDTTSKFAGFDPPPAAILFPNSKSADFFPWNGNHPEDTLSDGLVKGGVNNKPQIPNETNTARPALWSSLKNKSGLQTLSTLFVAVLEKRQMSNRLNSPSTFKLPPRVTLTDTNREKWLRDLANPTIPLRRLSRTIPHGIRGKLLLEQFMSKNIPTARAVWLAKCVGSNDMRAFKRKGAPGTVGIGGEPMFIREWTIFVEQFLENTMSSCGQPDWKAKMDYAVRLASHLYSDHLLDQDHYLDWLLTSLDASSLERLPVSLLLVQIYWQDLVASRRRGRRLAEALLTHAKTLHSDGNDETNCQLSGYLEKLIAKLVVTRPACLLLPKTWDTQKDVLLALANKHPDSVLSKNFRNLDRRNQRLSSSPQRSKGTPKSPKKEVITLLDSLEGSIDISVEKISTNCLELIPNMLELLAILLQWASSIYREGIHRIYLVTRLIRKLNTAGFDTDGGILSFLFSMQPNKGFEPRNVFRIVAELIRSKHFSVGRYLQWLIATGSTSRDHGLSQHWACHLRLIAELPLTGLPDHVINLRHTLLQSMGFPIESEQQTLASAQDFIMQQVPNIFESTPPVGRLIQIHISDLSTTIRLRLGCWIRQQVASKVEAVESPPTKGQPFEGPANVSTIEPLDFYTVRQLMEQLGDFSILADILGVVASSSDYVVLAAVSDTLHYHVRTFAAISAFRPLFQSLARRYANLRRERPPERELLLSLTDLARTAKAEPQLMQLLAYDLNRCEQKNLVAACSPASDNMSEIQQITSVDTDEDIERILASGTSMDEQIMIRVFNKITARLEEQLNKENALKSAFVMWFYRLEAFDSGTFERLMNQWLTALLKSHQSKSILAALPTLISSGCITLENFYRLSEKCIHSLEAKDGISAAKVSLDLLHSILPNDELNRFCQIQDAYRYRLEQQKLCAELPTFVLLGLRQAVRLCLSHSSADIETHLSSLLSSSHLLALMRQYTVLEVDKVESLLFIDRDSRSEKLASSTEQLFYSLLDPANLQGLSQKSLEEQASSIIEISDEFSLPFCKLLLRQLLETHRATSELSNDKVTDAILLKVKIAIENDRWDWSELLTGLEGDHIMLKIRQHAEGEILAISANLGKDVVSAASYPGRFDESFIRRYLTVIDLAATDMLPSEQAVTMTAIVDKLKKVVGMLTQPAAKTKDPDSMETEPSTTSTLVADVCQWLRAVLRLAIIHRPTSQVDRSRNQTQATFIWLLRALFTHPALQRFPEMTEYLFDVASYFSDDLPDDLRAHLTRLAAAKPSQDARSAFIFGTLPSPDGWLNLITPSTAPSSNATSTPQGSQCQPQTQSSYPNSQTQSPSPMPMHRSLSQQSLSKLAVTGQPQQQNKGPPGLQRFASAQVPSPQQMQMQQLAQQRSASVSPMQGLSQNLNQAQGSGAGTAGQASSGFWSTGVVGAGLGHGKEKVEVRSVPFVVRRWEVLPDQGSLAGGNDTALSLGLFEARRV